MGIAATAIDYASVLNPSQYRAVTVADGPVLVIAGAGSGKTRTLVYRVAFLVEQGVAPEAILLLTFTRKAATEMLHRAGELLDGRCHLVSGGTFHATGYHILHRYGECVGYPQGFAVMDQGDSEDVLGLLSDRLGLKRGARRFPKKGTIRSLFSKMINCARSLEAVLERDFLHFLDLAPDLERLHVAYTEYKCEQRVMDYDDLLSHWWRLLREWPGVRRTLAETYRYLMVDEYQDTNRLQAEIVTLLAGERRNVMVVGDDSQSIYSFRGADFQNIMDFPKTFPDAAVITLEENYRSTQPILDFTNRLISQARVHYTKCLFSRRPSDCRPCLVAARDEREQSLFVAQAIRGLERQGVEPGEVAVLFRAAFHSYDLEVELARVGIPYAKFGGLRFTEMAHLKDVVAHLRVVENPADAMSWHRLLLLVEGVGARTSQRLIRRLSEGMGASAALREFTAECRRSTLVHHLEPLAELFEELARPGQSLRDMVQAVCSYYEPIAVRKFDDFPKRMHDLHFLEDWAEQYATLQAMLTDLALEPPDFQGRKAAHGAAGMLTLSTIHSAKGMEWRVVFLIAAAEGRFPSPYAAYRDEEMEEELRLFYVASTRARERLVITYPRSFRGAWSDGLSGGPSPFLHAIPRECLERKTVERFCL